MKRKTTLMATLCAEPSCAAGCEALPRPEASPLLAALGRRDDSGTAGDRPIHWLSANLDEHNAVLYLDGRSFADWRVQTDAAPFPPNDR